MTRATIPVTGEESEALLAQMAAFRGDDADWHGGRTWSMIYYAGDAHHDFLKKAHNLYFAENALNPVAFRSLKRMEHEVVQMTASMLHGPEAAVGTLTSGGTESILMAVKTYRDRARRKWPWIRRPNLVVPRSIHPAFDKAAHYFDVRLRKVRLQASGQVDVAAMRRKIDRNTIGLAASAPQYVHGCVDPIPELAALATSRGLPLHVDACFGGFVLPWFEQLGVPMPLWDFRVAGVTSISADVHKYGYAAKGASCVVYRSMDWLRHQFFVCTDWPGGVYLSASMPGTRPGGTIAAAWAAMRHMGEDGYLALARECLDARDRLRAGITAMPELEVMGLPHSPVVSWRAVDPDRLDVFVVADQLVERGWSVDRQQEPISIHCSVNARNAPRIDAYLGDLREAVAWALAHPEASRQGEAAMYGMMSKVPIRGLVKNGVLDLMEQMYGPDGTEPDVGGGLGGEGRVGRLIDRWGPGAVDAWDRVRRRWRRG